MQINSLDIRQSIYSTFLSEIGESLKEENRNDIFEEVPLYFKDFVISPEHMCFPELSSRQLQVAEFMLGNDIYNVFNNKNTLAALMWGKGSGKDTLAALIILYVVYYLLCLKNPQKFFSMPITDNLDLVNCAASGEQAANVFFEKFKAFVLNWKWLNKKYQVRVSGTYIKQADVPENQPLVLVTKNGIIFPKRIRAFSGHSRETSVEGLNLICFTLDEAAAFADSAGTNNADKILRSMCSSATSRFGERWKGFVLSYPRYKNDIINRLYEASKFDLHLYGDKAATWEVKPKHLFSDKTFKFEDYEIPIDFEKEFKRDPEDAKCKYLCIAPDSINRFIEHADKVDQSIDMNRVPIILTKDIEIMEEGSRIQIGKIIEKLNLPMHQPLYAVTIDLGLKSDSAAMSIFHKEYDGDRVIFVQDFVTAWEPKPFEGKVVSLINIKEFIVSLKNRVNISKVWFDQWESAYISQELQRAGIPADIYKLTFSDYKNFKEKLYQGTIRLLNYPKQIEEIKKLELLKNGKVDHPDDFSKDVADTIVGAIKILDLSSKRQDEIFFDGEYVTPNLEEHGFFV